MLTNFHPYKASRCKKMQHNRGTGRLKTFRDASNRAVRIRSRRCVQRVFLTGNWEDGDNFGHDAYGETHWDFRKVSIMFDAHFISDIVEFALLIARQQRMQDHLQPADVLYRKFQSECKELAEAENIWDEIPDVVYYAACLIAHGENYCLCVLEEEILPQHDVSIEQAKKACLAKYRLRAAGELKNIVKERAAIMVAIS